MATTSTTRRWSLLESLVAMILVTLQPAPGPHILHKLLLSLGSQLLQRLYEVAMKGILTIISLLAISLTAFAEGTIRRTQFKMTFQINIFLLMIGFIFCEASSASVWCESIFQNKVNSFVENRAVFSMAAPLDRETVVERARIVVSRMKDIISKTRLSGMIELLEGTSNISVKEIKHGLYSIEISYRDKVNGTVAPGEFLYAVDNLILFSIPGDIQHSNRVFRFDKSTILEELTLGEFLITNIKEPWVALSRSMRTEEVAAWQSLDPHKLRSNGSFYNSYETKVYHFQLGLTNAYRSPGRKFLEFSVPKEDFMNLAQSKGLWASVNQVNHGPHGLLFELVVASSQVTSLRFKVESLTHD